MGYTDNEMIHMIGSAVLQTLQENGLELIWKRQ